MSIGITVLPERFTRVAPAGTVTAAVGAAKVIFVPSTTSVPFSITRPSPTISRAPSYAVAGGPGGGVAQPARKPRPRIAATARFAWRMEASTVRYVLDATLLRSTAAPLFSADSADAARARHRRRTAPHGLSRAGSARG